MKFSLFLICAFCALSCWGQQTEELTNAFIEKYKAGQYTEALPLALKAANAAFTEFGKKDINYAVCAENVGVTFFQLGKYEFSNQWIHEAIAAYSEVAGTDDIVEVHAAYHYVGNNHFGLGSYDSSSMYFVAAYNYFLQYSLDQYDNLITAAEDLSAISFTTGQYKDIYTVASALEPLIIEKEGKASQHYYDLQLSVAGAYRQEANFLKAYESYLQLNDLCMQLFGDASLEYADLLQFEADCLRNTGKYGECLVLLKKAEQIVISNPQADEFTKANLQHNLANYYGETAQFDTSYLHFDSTFILLNNAGMQKQPLYGIALKSRAYTAMDAAQYAQALQWIGETETWYRQQFPQGHPVLIELLVSRANVEYFTNQYQAAETHIVQAKQDLNNMHDTASYLFGRCYEIEAMIAHGKGNSQEAIALCKQSIQHNNSLLGDSNLYSANSLSNLGIIYQDIGEYAKAEEVLRESFAIKWKIYNGRSHPQLAISLANWAMVQIRQGRYKDADQLLAASVEIMKENKMITTPNGQAILNNVALLSQKMGDYSNALKLYHQLINESVSSGNSNTNIYAIATANLSTIQLSLHRYDSALWYAEKAMLLAENEYGTSSLFYLKTANNKLVALSNLGRFEEGRAQANVIIPIIKTSQGDSSEIMASTLSNLAALETKAGRFNEAAKLQQRSLDLQLRQYQFNLYALSERDQVSWWTMQSRVFQLQPALLKAADEPDNDLIAKMIDQQLQLKGYVLYNASSAIKKVRSIEDARVQKLLDQWQFLRSLYLAEMSKPIADRKLNTDSILYLSNVAEQTINTIAGHQLDNAAALGWKQIQSSLPEGHVAVEYISFPIIQDNWYTDAMQYGAIVIQREGQPKLVFLGTEAAIRWCIAGGKTEGRDVLINKLYRIKIGKVNTGVFTGDSLYQLIWKPLEPHIQNAKVIHLAPDGLLHKVALTALPISADEVVLDKWEVRQYASVRQLVSEESENKPIKRVLLAGHPDYNDGEKQIPNAYWSDLPGTATEINAIADFFSGSKIAVKKLTEREASEQSITKAGTPLPEIIHIATHGFFLQTADQLGASEIIPTTNDPSFLASFSDPFMRSGIVLSGANKYWDGTQTVESFRDGILTAYEIAQLDWSGVKVVTLSACETGLGDVQDSEGVFGLKRALKLAGVRYTIVSLWQVPDAETAELMSLFYQKLLEGNTVRKAFYDAQTAMRKKYKPFAWAAFVLSE